MTGDTIQEWTDVTVRLKPAETRDVRYRVYRLGSSHFLEMSDLESHPIHTLEMPEGMKLDVGSYEVLLRYVLLDVVAA